tara:strand:- start:1545 stop:2285 length:741 start_codon:yes stop_codon:yes gene_type:complete
MIFPDKKIIFLLPPKCGTSSFEKYVRENISLLNGGVDLNYTKRHTYLSQEIKKVDGDIQNFKIYQLCRNPIDRLVSSYYFIQKIIQGQKLRTPHKRNPLKNIRPKNIFQNYTFEEILNIILPDINSFLMSQEFISKMKNKNLNLPVLPVHMKNPYALVKSYAWFYLPQTQWNNLNLDVTYIKLEDLAKDCTILSEIFQENLPNQFPHKNISNNTNSLDYFNKHTLNLVKNSYKEDYELCNYAFPNK